MNEHAVRIRIADVFDNRDRDSVDGNVGSK
jgi:hypothetical protein